MGVTRGLQLQKVLKFLKQGGKENRSNPRSNSVSAAAGPASRIQSATRLCAAPWKTAANGSHLKPSAAIAKPVCLGRRKTHRRVGKYGTFARGRGGKNDTACMHVCMCTCVRALYVRVRAHCVAASDRPGCHPSVITGAFCGKQRATYRRQPGFFGGADG